MKEYYRCKRCYSELFIKRIARHHTKVHPDIPHDIFIDHFFDLNRPLYKCDFCSCKLPHKRLIKHLKRAHIFDNHPYQSDKLPFTQAVPAASSTSGVIEISSDSDFEDLLKGKDAKEMMDKSVQCDGIKNKLVDKGTTMQCELKEIAVNTETKTTKEVGTQTSIKKSASAVEKRMQLSLEVDKDDGWLELVLS